MPLTYEIVSDLIDQASSIKQYSLLGTLTFGQINRVFQVRVIGETNPMMLGPDAESHIKTQVPVGTQHDAEPLCKARYYSWRGIGSPDIVEVIVGYVFTEIPVSATVWQIDSDSYTEMVQTDQEIAFGTGDFIPIKVANYILAWTDPTQLPPSGAAGTPEPAAFGVVTAPRWYKRWRYTKQIYSKNDALAYDAATINYVGRVNSNVYNGMNAGGINQALGLAPFTVACVDAGVVFNPYQGLYLAHAEMVYKPLPDSWIPWVRFSNSVLGVPDNVWRNTSPGATPYGPNGTRQPSVVFAADLNTLLTLI